MTCQTMDKLGGNTGTEKSLPHLAISHQLYQPPEAPTTPLLDQASKAQIVHLLAISIQFHRASPQLPHQHFNDPRRDPHTKHQPIPRYHLPNSLRPTTAQHPARDFSLILQTNRARLTASRPSVVSSPIKPKPKRPSPLFPHPLKHKLRHHKQNSHRSMTARPARDNHPTL